MLRITIILLNFILLFSFTDILQAVQDKTDDSVEGSLDIFSLTVSRKR